MSESMTVGGPKRSRKKLAVFVVAVIAGVSCIVCVALFIVMPLAGRVLWGSKDEQAYGTTISNVTHGVDYVLDGNWLYTFNNAVNAADGGVPAAIKRTKTDGSVSEVIYTPDARLQNAWLSDLFLVNDRLFFRQSSWDDKSKEQISWVVSVGVDGRDAQIVADLKGDFMDMQIATDRIYFTRNDSLYSMSLEGKDRKRICDAGYNNWVVCDGYVYVTDTKDSKYAIRRCSLDADEAEFESLYALYQGGISYVTPVNNKLIFTESIDPNSTSSYAKQLVSVDIDSGDKDVLYKEPYNGESITSWSIAGDTAILCLHREGKSTSFCRIALDGSKEEEFYTYDGDWAGNPLRTRNLGASDDVQIYRCAAFGKTLFFEGYSSEVLSSITTDNWEKPIYTPLCSVNTDGSNFTALTLMSSASVESEKVKS